MNEHMSETDKKRMLLAVDVIEALPEGRGYLIDEVGANYELTPFGIEILRPLGKDEKLFHVIVMLARSDTKEYVPFLERNYFPIGTALNKEFTYRVVKWQNTLWGIVTVPIYRADYCYEAARRCGMRLADGIPHIFQADGTASASASAGNMRKMRSPQGTKVHTFPLESPRAFTVEPFHGHNRPVMAGIQLV